MEWVWTREKFFNRKFVMQEMFEKCQDGEEWEKPQVHVSPIGDNSKP